MLLCTHTQTAQYSTQIFSLAVLLSCLFVYNHMGGIDESALDRLSLVTEMTKHIRVKAGQGEHWTVLFKQPMGGVRQGVGVTEASTHPSNCCCCWYRRGNAQPLVRAFSRGKHAQDEAGLSSHAGFSATGMHSCTN
jgi:hypothetical protein